MSLPAFQINRDYAGRQSIGSREEQQDSYAFSLVEGTPDAARKILLVVADGMGGYLGGREASQAAVQAFVDSFFDSRKAESDASLPPVLTSLRKALDAANEAVGQLADSNPQKFASSGTTLVAILVDAESLHWISVGDSPLFLFRNDSLRRLNADHSMRAILAAKVAAGQMLEKDLKTHPQRNVLLSALVGGDIAKIDAPTEPTPLLPGDILLTASDGIFTIPDSEISSILTRSANRPASEISSPLVEQVEAKQLPKQDNTTATIIKISQHSHSESQRPKQEEKVA